MEYLAPGVYVEEVSSGNKPIEGASTSTAGMVGVTQRGPVNTPTLVTSFGEFSRVFGGLLDHRTFTENRDALPYAAQGFFTNGGQRLYVSRITGPAATFANTDLYAVPVAGAAQLILAARAATGSSELLLLGSAQLANLAPDDELLLIDDVRSEYVSLSDTPTAVGVQLNAPLRLAAAAATTVTMQTLTAGDSFVPAGDMVAGGTLQMADADIALLQAGDILMLSHISNPSQTEFVSITTDASADFDEGALLFNHTLANTSITRVTLADDDDTTLSAAAAAGDNVLALSSTAGFAPQAVVLVGATELRLINDITHSVPLNGNLIASHSSGVMAEKQLPLLRVVARYQGLWGNSLLARVRSSSMLETTVRSVAAAGETLVILDALFGLSNGSYISFYQGNSLLQTVLVESVNRARNEVAFTNALTTAVPAGCTAVSLEYDLIIERLDNGKVAEAEVFEKLGMHPAHNRYGPKIVGSFNRASAIASNSGESELVRLADLTLAENGTPLGDSIVANRASRLSSVVARLLNSGDDDLPGIDDAAYIGNFADDPAARTGIQSLENEESISMVSVPGRTDITLQNTLLNHCEKMRYRFAILETPRDSNLKAAISHRQNFDTTRGAIYYPWLVVADSFGEKGDLLRISPCGHVMGIYARTDTTRGVWKAPANEVVRGILQFETALTKGEQDMLNPIGINAFRDFRTANRGLRLWGARTLSSDPEWKYINVRRLFLFLEQSIERGMQFAVFEPNTEMLWASVKQSISNFLIGIWRSGGLEGIKQEEAFFVNVGYNLTMTQTDIDNGRLIVEVGVAPVKPAEFVIIRISQKTREASA